MLREMSLSHITPDWQGTEAIAATWFPQVTGWFDERIVQVRGIQLLRALVFVVRDGPDELCTMETVRQLVVQEDQMPHFVFGSLTDHHEEKVRTAAQVAISARGCWFGDAVPFLAANLTDWRATEILRRNSRIFGDGAMLRASGL